MTYTKRGEPLTKPCKQCGKTITRPYKMTIAHWEKRQFCSQKCNGLSRVGEPSRGKPRSFTEEEKMELSKRMKGNQYAKGYTHTEKAKKAMSSKRKGSLHPMWKGHHASYSAFHKWLVKNYGPATCCENKLCNSGSTDFEYAKLNGKQHAHKRENYIQLCVICHASYDKSGKVRFRL